MVTERQSIFLSRFEGADAGQWKITSMCVVRGDSLPSAPYLAIDSDHDVGTTAWTLRGAGSNLRYTTASERASLQAKQEGLGRPASTRAALIPIRKSADWWAMAQDERRAIYFEGSHLPIGLDYLPGVARKLYHARDHGERSPIRRRQRACHSDAFNTQCRKFSVEGAEQQWKSEPGFVEVIEAALKQAEKGAEVLKSDLDAILGELSAREPLFHHRELGTSREDLLKMTADDFWEIGASGRAYDRDFVIENLLEFYKGPEPDGWSCSDFSIRQLAEGLYQLNYILQQPDRQTRRTTLWRKIDETWQIVFHQGTVMT